MNKVDVNCMLGHWPFKKIYKESFEDLKKVHADNNIEYGYVSSINSIFYNDPFEGEYELHKAISGTQYRHLLSTNPCLPDFERDVQKGVEMFDIKGVRVYPGYHNYKLDSNELQSLCSLLKDLGLPLFLTLRLEDERLNYLSSPRPIPLPEISDFLNSITGIDIVLLNVRLGELMALKNCINDNSRVKFDTSGLKDGLFTIEKLLGIFDTGRILYGSQYPLYCLKSTELLIEKADIPQEIKDSIFCKNAAYLG